MLGTLTKKPAVAFVLIFVLSALVSGCSGSNMNSNSSDSFPMASLENMPINVQESPVIVQQSYQFAVANPDTLKQIPCYCGCGSMGHTSNYACYVKEENPGGDPVYDNHALGCSICVDITQDTMRLLNQGKTVPEILTYVDKTYSQFGPSNVS